MATFCESCFEKQRRIDALTEENLRLKQQLAHYRKRAKQGYFGEQTSSAKLPFKANSSPTEKKRPGAKPGHKGYGRKRFSVSDADEILDIVPDVTVCPNCGGSHFYPSHVRERCTLDLPPITTIRRLYRLTDLECQTCHTHIPAVAPDVMPKNLYGNNLLCQIAFLHYGHGFPLNRLCKLWGLNPATLIDNLHRLGKTFQPLQAVFQNALRSANVKHADETSWRIQGKNGYAWLFANTQTSLFAFKNTRSAQVPQAILGTQKIPGVLVVDRYAAYNCLNVAKQYCFAHLLRSVKQLKIDFPNEAEVQHFAEVLMPLMADAIKLSADKLSKIAHRQRARKIQNKIMQVANTPATHPGIHHIQEIFLNHQDRLFHWGRSPDIPAENNLAERDLRPTVIARKISFGSASPKGADTRSIWMSVIHTLSKRQGGPASLQWLNDILQTLAHNPRVNLTRLFPKATPT
ncbi:IS66 family transposase [bacterium]|nr:IS66 family transposase [bacterium]